MGLDLSAVVNGRAKLEIEFCGQVAHVTYNPMLVTHESLEKLDEEDEGTNKFITRVVTDWDITHGKKKIPINLDQLRKLPIPLTRAIALGILGDRGDASGEAETNSKGG